MHTYVRGPARWSWAGGREEDVDAYIEGGECSAVEVMKREEMKCEEEEHEEVTTLLVDILIFSVGNLDGLEVIIGLELEFVSDEALGEGCKDGLTGPFPADEEG